MDYNLKKKLAFIVPYRFVPPKNGGHKAAYGFASFLAQEVPLLCISSSNNSLNSDFELIPCFEDRPAKYIDPRVAWRILKVLKQAEVDLCIFHQPFQVFLLWPLLRFNGIQTAIFAQNIEYLRFKSIGKWWWPLMYLFEWFTFRMVDQLYFIAPSDSSLAQERLGVHKQKCIALNYGIYQKEMPGDRAQSKIEVCNQHNFDASDRLILFFGPQSYQPNLEAVLFIKDKLYPALKRNTYNYQILICGGGLPENHQAEIAALSNMHYLGFVADIEKYVKAADVMINPISTGGGVKTKVIESIGLGTPVLSFRSGAEGFDHQLAGNMIQVVDDGDLVGFTVLLNQYLSQEQESITPAAFYTNFHWETIIKGLIAKLVV